MKYSKGSWLLRELMYDLGALPPAQVAAIFAATVGGIFALRMVCRAVLVLMGEM